VIANGGMAMAAILELEKDAAEREAELVRVEHARRIKRDHSDSEASMADNKYMTPEEVSERYRGGITVGTLRNWRALRIGPAFVKIGKAVLYPVEQLDVWDQKNMVVCRASISRSVDGRDRE
jgi:hypothetical protein